MHLNDRMINRVKQTSSASCSKTLSWSARSSFSFLADQRSSNFSRLDCSSWSTPSHNNTI